MTNKKIVKNPWTILNTECKYQNPWIKVDESQVLTPHGQPGIYGTVEFKNRAVGILPLSENNETWLVGQYRFPLNEYHWEIPMGGAPEDEDIKECAKRELREEVGIIATQWTDLGEFVISNSITNERGYLYLAKELEFTETDPDPTELLQVKKLPFQKVFEMAMSGEITDALSVLAIQRIRLLQIA